ncbi:hypothetical protein F2P81_005629 [Scophthalmus maximus]|uniref:Coiled-coil domain-containing protein n=1 Tax=Scophthalmus maximus TaxID=52904 RepID=A0A6A4T741_SCOMX|nr:hypothetical protein F2P81_005629 [Scophthalmus maximus]
MAECNISIDQKKLPGVKEVCRDFAVLEDHCLAYNLQEQEIESHLASNVHKSRLVQKDLQVAKKLQEEEDKRAKSQNQKQHGDIERQDNEIAQEIQEELVRQAELQRQQEEKDAAIARKLQEKEMKEEKRRQKQKEANFEEDYFEDHGGRIVHRGSGAVIAETEYELSEATKGLTKLDLREQELKDMEVARKLQEDEINVGRETRQASKMQTRAAQVAQDEEIARLLMEQEKKEYKKNREREKEKERERERMAMERRRPEGDSRQRYILELHRPEQHDDYILQLTAQYSPAGVIRSSRRPEEDGDERAAVCSDQADTMASSGMQLLGFFLSLLGVSATVAATFMVEWKRQAQGKTHRIYEGLWMSCSGNERTTCELYESLLKLPKRAAQRGDNGPERSEEQVAARTRLLPRLSLSSSESLSLGASQPNGRRAAVTLNASDRRAAHSQADTMASSGMQLLGFFLSLLGVSATVAATFMVEWKRQAQGKTHRIYEGLWMSCSGNERTTCELYESLLKLPTEVQATRAVMLLSVFLSAVALMVSTVGMKCTRFMDDKSESKSTTAMIGGIMFMVSVILSCRSSAEQRALEDEEALQPMQHWRRVRTPGETTVGATPRGCEGIVTEQLTLITFN